MRSKNNNELLVVNNYTKYSFTLIEFEEPDYFNVDSLSVFND